MSLAKIVANAFTKSSKLQSLASAIAKDSSKVSVATSNIVNVGVRPPLIMLTTKSKNLMDGAYSSASSICSAIGETITQNTILKPFNKSVDKSIQQLSSNGFFDDISKKFSVNPSHCGTMVKSTLGRIGLIVLVPLNGFIKGKILPPVAKTIGKTCERKKLNVTV